MHTLLRPALYDAFHFIWPVNVAPEHVPPMRAKDLSRAPTDEEWRSGGVEEHKTDSSTPLPLHPSTPPPPLPGLDPCDIVGPICETADFLSTNPATRPLPPVAKGDLLAVFTTGAYGMSMSSRYNSHPLPAEVLIDHGQATIIRQRETYADLVEHEMEPEAIGM